MTKMTYLNKNGEVVRKSFKDIGATWEKMNEARVDYATKQEVDYLKKYGLRPTIFNVSNLRKFGHVQLPEHYVNVVLNHGAKDKRRLSKLM